MKDAQKFATQIFITASVLFGVTGVFMVLTTPARGVAAEWLIKTLFTLGFIVLGSFGVSVGLKYLSDK